MLRHGNDSKDALLNQVCEQIKSHAPKARIDELTDFARTCLASASIADLAEWRLDDLYGAILASWHFLQTRIPQQPKVLIVNPDYEQHGWQSSHTVIVVLQDDMPFIIDSLRIELNRRNLVIHAIYNALLMVKRDAEHRLQKLLGRTSRAKGATRESLVLIEVDRHTNPAQLAELERSLLSVLEDVRMTVEDFTPMVTRCEQLQQEFDTSIKGLEQKYVDEVRDFIGWLKWNFTFLGYDEFRLQQREGQPVLEPIMGSQLGLLKYCDEECRSSLLTEGNRDAGEFVLVPEILSFTKSATKSRVHRPAYPDYISLKRFDDQGRVVGEARFLGLYTSSVYIQSSRQIPIVRRKVDEVMALSQLPPQGHDWKELMQILEIYPRDDLFQSSVEELAETAMGIQNIHERRQIRLFLRRDRFGLFFSCLVYAPREVYSTVFRRKAEIILCHELDCDQVEFTTYFSESILARTQFILRNSRGEVPAEVDVPRLEKLLREAGRSWLDHLYDALVEALGEEQGIHTFNRFSAGIAPGYQADFNPRTAVVDIQHIARLSADAPLQLSFYRALEKEADTLNFKLFHQGAPLPLSDVLPVLEHLGLRVIDEHPYRISSETEQFWIHDFNLAYTGSGRISLSELKDLFQDAFLGIWQGLAVSDDFNRLVLAARIGWREVAMLRAYAAYMKQIRFPISSEAISSALNHHVRLARLLVELFHARFDPEHGGARQQVRIKQAIMDGLDEVASLNEDQVIRQYLMLIEATLRTNYFQRAGALRKYHFSFKLSPREIPELPRPRPMFEIFVYSPQVEGVHLRSGKVARGGLRWSDRQEDYRTEVLGLVKAQQVKNAVIVPVGAKGGFVAKQLNDAMSREDLLLEGMACYRTFISGLLDVTDNLHDGAVVAPPQLVRHDDDDPYLVVAADKGTATFSDIANDVALDYGFWLGDAFASGGSQGYDHKKMGITARGAWVSVERHFRELGLNTAAEDFTVIGIGDMSGDVFGNGMLLSRHIRLQAAFNHQHIFIDPSPDAEASWQERRRLFELPRSGWSDYDVRLISPGGGVFSRSAKAVRLSPEIRKLTGLRQDSVTPHELIRALLRAPVDLLWNGGIGTYVKATGETDTDIGDKANDAVRINGSELGARVVAEGGNLGLSQRARIEYALAGGRLNSDFIDNSGGVNCSDHEVNIKILLDRMVAQQDMTEKQRNRLLVKMTDQVAALVLQNNYRQVQAISLAEARSHRNLEEYRRFIQGLEQSGKLDRALEFIPDEEALTERRNAGLGLTRPELSVLLSYSKAELKQALLKTAVPDDPYLSQELQRAFPDILGREYQQPLAQHRLRREIVATEIANHIVNFMGINFVHRLRVSTGADNEVIARSYILARDVIDVRTLWQQIEALDYQVPAQIQIEMMLELQHLARRTTRWYVRNRRGVINCRAEIERFRAPLAKLARSIGTLVCGEPKQIWDQAYDHYLEHGVPKKLATLVAGTRILYSTLGIIEVAAESDVGVETVARAYFELGERLQLHWFAHQLNELKVDNYWQAMARESFRDDLDWQQRVLVSSVLAAWQRGSSVAALIERWYEQNRPLIQRWRQVLNELKATRQPEYAMYMVAVRELFELARNSQFQAREVAE